MNPSQQVVAQFRERLGGEPVALVRSPGRVNLLGEHTDYNDGFALPMAIDRNVCLAMRPRQDQKVVLHALAFDETAQIDLRDLQRGNAGWQEYLKGVAWALTETGAVLRGFDGVVDSDLPVGAGLSSSAALELALARAFCAATSLPWQPRDMALLAQRAENEFVGVRCGAMDQLAAALGRHGHALLLDFLDNAAVPVPLPPSTRVLILDSATRRSLSESRYNDRRQQCEGAAAALGVDSLRQVTLAQIEQRRDALTPEQHRRARHVLSENDRTQRGVEALRRGDGQAFGVLMNASHASLRDDFEVSTEALDAIVDCARAHPACLGARMTGAGFGGCAVALVDSGAAGAAAEQIQSRYRQRTGLQARVCICNAADGTDVSVL